MAHSRDAITTSRMMARVRSKDSKAELALRKALHRRGIRYRVHVRTVFGTPDIAIKRYRLAVFVDGDMWHGREHLRRGLTSMAEMFPTNTDFWVKKITRNIERDTEVNARLRSEGWTVVRLWESDVLRSPDAAAILVQEAIERRAAGLVSRSDRY
jgi:DNA mismatch endonuclease, patch repair protein